MRGGAVTPGGTSVQQASAVDTHFWAHGRKLLLRFRKYYEQEHGPGSWEGPDPSEHGPHKLSGALLLNDTCSPARCTAKLIREAVAAAVEAYIIGKKGQAAWTKMPPHKQAAKKTLYLGDCWQHMRNIFIDHMTKEAAAHLAVELKEHLQAFSSYERMSTNGMDLIRAVYKELHPGGDYAKGDGINFEDWRRRFCPGMIYMAPERAAGGRQDLEFDASVPIFVDRPLFLKYLTEKCLKPDHSNVLESFLWATLSSVEMGALLRVNTLWDLLLSQPMRWLCGSADKLSDWSIFSMGAVLDEITEGLAEIAADGEKLLDPELDLFAGVAAKQPAFAQWREEFFARKVTSPDGTTRKVLEHALSEARLAMNDANYGSTPMTIELAEVMAQAALHKIRDPKLAISSWGTETDGAKSIGKSAAAHAATRGAHTTNDLVESIFGCYDYVARHFRGISPEAASGMALMMRMHYLDRPSQVAQDRRKAKGESPSHRAEGFFWQLPQAMQMALVGMARKHRLSARKEARADRAEQMQYRQLKREQNLEKQRIKTVELYARAMELFEAWQARGVKSDGEITKLLRDKSDNEQRKELREQIEMRVIGLGMLEFETAWSSKDDDNIGTVSHLRPLLNQILVAEKTLRRDKSLPDEAVPPPLKVKTLKTLGTPTAHAEELEKEAKMGAEQLKEAALAEQRRRIEAGIVDDVANVMTDKPGLTTAELVGRRLEICWGTYYEEGKEGRIKMWCPCRVKRVADGANDKGSHSKPESARARKILPAGAVLVTWDPDVDRGEAETVMWLVLHPDKWNGQGHLAWRWHPDELESSAKR